MSTNTEVSKVQVTKQATVDAANPNEQTSTTAVASEPSMAEVAARRDAEARGETYVPAKPAAAATDDSAAATDEGDEDDKTKQAAPPTDEELLEQIGDTPAKKGINERMSKLANDRKAAEESAKEARAAAEKATQEAAAAKQELERIRAEAKAKADEAIAAAALPAEKDDVRPNRDDFEDPDEYAIALAAFGARQEIRKANEAALKLRKESEEKAQAEAKKVEQAKIQASVETLHKNFNERLKATKADYPDFDEKVSNNDKLNIRNEAFFLIEKSELGPHILYKLANDPEELKNLNALAQTDPAAMALRIGEIQAEIKIARKPKVSQAKEPHKPVGQRQSPARKSPDEETTDEYMARRREEDRAAAKQRSGSRIH